MEDGASKKCVHINKSILFGVSRLALHSYLAILEHNEYHAVSTEMRGRS